MLRNCIRHIVIAILTALIIGTLSGGIEAYLFYSAPKAHTPPPLMILLVTATYALYWGGLGVLTGLIAGIVSRRKHDQTNPAPLFGRYLIVFLCLYGLLFAFGFLHREYGDDVYGLQGVLMLAGVLIALAVIGLLLIRLTSKVNRRAFGFSVTGIWIIFLAIIIVIGLQSSEAAVGGALAKKTTEKRPNILYVLVDALRADHLGCYGYERNTSPAVDALGQDGVRFERCFAQSSWTRPSIASMLTSTVPPLHQVTGVFSALKPEFKVLPDDMSDFGYLTASFSASALISRTFGFGMQVDGYKCSTRGLSIETGLFETRLGILHAQIGNAGRLGWIGDTVYRVYNKVFRNLVKVCAVIRDEFKNMQGNAESVNETFLNWLDQIDGARFSAYLHYMEPHAPYDPDRPFNTMFERNWQGESNVMHPQLFPLSDKIMYDFPPIEEAALEDMIALYDGEIAQFSHNFDILVKDLKERGIYDDTLIIFVSDHGDEFYDHKSWSHGHTLYNELIRVPLIIKFPRSQFAGKVVSAPCQAIDIVPTIFDLLQVEVWKQAQGRSLLPLIKDEASLADEAWTALITTGREGAHLRSYVENDFKLVHATRGNETWWLLFDMQADPGEHRNLVEEKPLLFARLKQQLEEKYALYDSLQGTGIEAEISPDMEEKLRALGYIK